MNAAEAAARLGLSYRTVIRSLDAGAIAGERRGKEWLIAEDEVERVRGNIARTLEPIAPELAAAEMLTEQIALVRAQALREAIANARSIVTLAEDAERRVTGGAVGIATTELGDTLTRHVAQIAKLDAVFRGTAATYRAIRDHLVGIARLEETGHDHIESPAAAEEAQIARDRNHTTSSGKRSESQ